MNVKADAQESLSAAWADFEDLNKRLSRYVEDSGTEFGRLIGALDDCWKMAESVQKATAGLADLIATASESQNDIRQSILDGCSVFRASLNQIQDVNRQLASAAEETKGLLGTSNQLQDNLVPLRYIAFYFRLEASRLPPDDSASVLTIYDEVRGVVNSLKLAGDSQERALVTILEKISAATRAVAQESASYAVRATESEEKVGSSLALLSRAPTDLMRVKNKAETLGTVLAKGTREAVKALQGHDAIRQRLEHIQESLCSLRDLDAEEPSHVLLLQREQAKCVLELIINTGQRIEEGLNSVSDCTQALAGEGTARTRGDEIAQIDQAADDIASLNGSVADLLSAAAKIGTFVLTQIGPIRELLNANSDDFETLARSVKRVALNVLVAADKMASAVGVGVLGNLTSEAAEHILKLAENLNAQRAQSGYHPGRSSHHAHGRRSEGRSLPRRFVFEPSQ